MKKQSIVALGALVIALGVVSNYVMADNSAPEVMFETADVIHDNVLNQDSGYANPGDGIKPMSADTIKN